MCDVRTTTVITFIFRINTLSFPLCRHFWLGGRGWFYFFSTELKLSKFCLSFTPDSASTLSLEITHNPSGSLRLASVCFPAREKGEDGGRSYGSSLCGVIGWGFQIQSRSCLSPSRSALLSSSRLGCVATSKHFFHACLSAARRLGPLTVNLPERCEGQTQAAFLQTRFWTWANSGKTLSVDVWSFCRPPYLMST